MMPSVTRTSGTLNPFEMIRQDKIFFAKLMALALPMAMQNLVASSLNLLDTFMIGQLGESAIAAVALSNQIFFLQMLLLFGITSGSAVFTAQFWGKKDEEGLHRSTGLALLLALSGAGVFTLLSQLLPEEILSLFSKDPQVIEKAVPYLRITSASYLFSALTMVYAGVLRTTGEARLPLFISLGAIGLNALFNYLLIFGKVGFPKMGTTGAALATALARFLEAAVLLTLMYGRKSPAAFRPGRMGSITGEFLKKFFHRIYPVLINEVGWSLGITMFTLVFARMGTEVIASYNVTDTVLRFTFFFFMGAGNACAVVLGNMIGEGKDFAHLNRLARKILYLAPLFALLASLLIFSLSPVIPLLFKVSPPVRDMISGFLKVAALVVLFKVSNMQIIVGILRSGGDTHFCAAMELVPLWLMAIPFVALAGLVLGWNPVLVYALGMSEEAMKYVIGLKRVLSGKWIHNLT